MNISPALTIASHTYRETIRDRILYGILAFAIIFILGTSFLGSISLGEEVHVVRSLGMGALYIFEIITAIFLGVSLLRKEFERKTLYFILSKPVSRLDIILGKFIGLSMTMALVLAIMTGVYLGVVYTTGGGFDVYVLGVVTLQFFEIMLFIALSICLSSFASPVASTIYAALILYIGHGLGFLLEAAIKAEAPYVPIVKALSIILPNLEKFNARELALYHITPSISEFLLAGLYAGLYGTLFLYLALIIFKQREL